MTLFHTDDLVVLAANRFHLGIVRADQASSTSDVLVQWMDTPPVQMRPDEMMLESTHRMSHPAYLEPRNRPVYDIFEPICEELGLWLEVMG